MRNAPLSRKPNLSKTKRQERIHIQCTHTDTRTVLIVEQGRDVDHVLKAPVGCEMIERLSVRIRSLDTKRQVARHYVQSMPSDIALPFFRPQNVDDAQRERELRTPVRLV